MTAKDKQMSDLFLGELVEWLILTHDPRLKGDPQCGSVDSLAACAADFCLFMAKVCDAGYKEADWR